MIAFWEGKQTSVVQRCLNFGSGILSLLLNEVCFGNAYLDQPGIPFVLFMGGDKRLPGVFIDAGGFEEMPCSNPD